MALDSFLPDWWPPYAPWALIAIATLYAVVMRVSSTKIDPREPPVIISPIPFIGHLLGMLILGSRYIKNLGFRNPDMPIFTLPVPGSRLYIVTDTAVAAAVQRASKTLSMTPIIPEVTERILGLDKQTMDITRKNLDPAPGAEKGFLAEIQEMVYSWLGSGEYLNELTTDAVGALKDKIDLCRSSLSTKPHADEVVDLLGWVRHLVTVATARYAYGPQNPIALDPSLEYAFWDFDHGVGLLMMNLAPSITARKAYLGRERLVAALANYLEKGTYKTGSKIVQERIAIALRHGWAVSAAARSELSFLFANIVNVTTTSFWVLLRVFADKDLLSRVRREIEAITTQESMSTNISLNLEDLTTKCPLVVSVYKECLRLSSYTYTIRLVKEPTIVGGRYFLAKGGVVQIANSVIHGDKDVWGSDVDTFNPDRFLGQQQNSQKQAFRPFGGGKTLCPGRHFAMNEILSFIALVLLQLEIVSPNGSGRKIKVPLNNDTVLPVHVLGPVERVNVALKLRGGWEEKNVSIRKA